MPVFWSVECSRCLFSNSNQSPGKTPCRWKNNFHNNPSGSHWESSYIPWWHYVLRLFSSSAVTVLRKKKRLEISIIMHEQRFYQRQLAHPLTAAAVCHRAAARLWGQLLKWWCDNSTCTVQERPASAFFSSVACCCIWESQELISLSTTVSSLLRLIYRKKPANQLGDNIWKSAAPPSVLCLFNWWM